MNDRNLNPAYHEALASARGISTTAPRAVGEFQGFIDGEPAVRWIDRKNMPNVGDMLYAVPGRALQHAGFPITIWDGSKLKPSVRSWSILLTSANDGTVGPLGSTFPHAGEHHERVVVVEVPAGAGAPSDQVNLVLRAAPAAEASASTVLTDERDKEIERLQIELAAVRDLFPIPDSGELHNLWAEACSDPFCVLGYVKGHLVAAQAGQVAVPEAVAAEMKRLHDALCFWIPQSRPDLPDAMQERIAADAYLLVGYDDMPDPKSAEQLGWVTAAPAVAQQAPAPGQAEIEWSHDVQERLIEAGVDESDEVRGLMAEAASLLSALTGRPAPSPAKESK